MFALDAKCVMVRARAVRRFRIRPHDAGFLLGRLRWHEPAISPLGEVALRPHCQPPFFPTVHSSLLFVAYDIIGNWSADVNREIGKFVALRIDISPSATYTRFCWDC